MANLDETPIIDLGKNPIPGDNPGGIDASEEPQYFNTVGEVGKVDRIEADEPDWYQIEEDTKVILGHKSKDVEMAVALGHALFKRNSYAGLAAALGLINELIRNFWEHLHPGRPRRRKARIETLADRFTEGLWFRENQPQGDDFDAIDKCLERAEELKNLLTEKMPDDPPELRKFIEGLKSHAEKRPKQAEPPPAPAAAPAGGGAPAAAPATGAAAGGGAGSFSAGEINDISGAINAMLSASTFIRKADAAEPMGYAISRLIKWSKIELPTSDEAKFNIPAPDAQKLDALQHQMTNSLWDHLLNGAEAAFRSEDPLWLDLQRYSCAAMTGLGAKYDKARETIMTLTAGLVNRLGSGLFELQFRGGIPLCSGETKMWIESEVTAGQGGGGSGGSAGGAADNGKLAEASDKARKLAGSGKIKEALAELREGLMTSTQRRERLLWRLRIAQLCFDAKRLQLAAPLLEECSEEIRRYNIDEWEPTLAVDVAQTLYRCRKMLTAGSKDVSPEDERGVRDSFAWLCQLDPLAALAAEPSSK